MSRVRWLGVQRVVNDRSNLRIRDRERAAGPRSVTYQTSETGGEESPPPEGTGVGFSAVLLGELLVPDTLRGSENDLEAKRHSMGSGSGSRPRGQPDPFFVGEGDPRSHSYKEGFAFPVINVANPEASY